MDNSYQPYSGNGGQTGNMPPQNNLVLAILATIFSVLCCGIQSLATLPLGIMAIVKANDVNKLFFAGHVNEAYMAAKNAKTFSIISLCITLVFFVISLIIGLVFGFSGILEQMKMGNM